MVKALKNPPPFPVHVNTYSPVRIRVQFLLDPGGGSGSELPDSKSMVTALAFVARPSASTPKATRRRIGNLPCPALQPITECVPNVVGPGAAATLPGHALPSPPRPEVPPPANRTRK